jgi:anti-sigma factor (TIGR02949 family)
LKARCSDLTQLLLDFVEGQLPPDTHASLQQHLTSCPECVAVVRTYESTRSLLHSLTDADLPPELRARLRAFLDKRATS